MSSLHSPDLSGLAEQDWAARRHALDGSRSFIVQAPAGSGKTELLTQRLLVLLGQVQKPEEVLAITFTRKAAGEMRDRILERLQQALELPRPDSAHQQLSWDLARKVMLRDAELGWGLLESPQRLQLLTFDALSALLVRQMPWLSQFGGPVSISERPMPLYRQAAEATLAVLESPEDEAPELVAALHDWSQQRPWLVQDLVRLLAVREHWAPYLLGGLDLVRLAQAWQQELEPELEPLAVWADGTWPRLVEMAQFAANHKGNAWQCLLHLPSELPDAWLTPERLSQLKALAELLLDSKCQWRTQITAREGFPAKAPKKATMLELLAEIAEQGEDLRQLLSRLRQSGFPAGLTPANAESLAGLAQILSRAYLELQLVFAERGEADFSEISRRALQALGSEQQPTDLALRLDARFNHILVDEFQDTSEAQVQLLRLLTSGWQPGDGRSLLVVGDPMQSIYRFRQAEVGLFLQIQRQGLKPELPLEPLFLRQNFRSQAGILDWVNASFARVFPAQPDERSGGVPYEPSLPTKAPEAVAVELDLSWDLPDSADRSEASNAEPEAADALSGSEAARVVLRVQAFQQQNPEGRVAILVRARSHLASILPALRAAGLAFQAVELEFLHGRQAIQDLLSLIYALRYPADRTHWLAVLRAPWCGLTLADLHQLFWDRPAPESVWPLLSERLPRLSTEGQQRLDDWLQRLQPLWSARGRLPWRDLIESAWLQLGGPGTLATDSELADVQQVLNLLDACCQNGILDEDLFRDGLESLFAAVDPEADSRLQLMTIHKAKGLEFDLVLIPGMATRGKSGDSQLLYWLPGASPLLAVPSRQEPQLAQYLKYQHQQADALELARLLYVGVTRAKRQLVLLASFKPAKAELKPPANSLLALIWGLGWTQAQVQNLAEPELLADGAGDLGLDYRQLLRHPLPALAVRVEPELPLCLTPLEQEDLSLLPLHASLRARELGILCHRLLEQMAREGAEHWPEARLCALEPLLVQSLRGRQLPLEEARSAAQEVVSGLIRLQQSPQHRWLLQRQTQDAVEYGLTLVAPDGLQRLFLDRTFVDADGVRWILDYKTGRHQGADLAAYVALQAERYRAQLEGYAAAMAQLDARPIKLALYFTAHGHLHTWDWTGTR